MNLLDKLDAVEVKVDNRISADDRRFCEAHQVAYVEAKAVLTEVRRRWKEIVESQKEILNAVETETYARTGYVSMQNFSASDLKAKIEGLHSLFIHRLVIYFNNRYNVSVELSAVEESLLPKKPKQYGWNADKEAVNRYHKELRELSLRYEDVLEQIFIQLGGRTFHERALDELKEKCHSAAWNSYRKTADYEIKGDVIRFTFYACKYDSLISESWELQDGMKDILRGIAHFEMDEFKLYPVGFSELLDWSSKRCPLFEFSCHKIKHLKMFKNGKVDVKFTNKTLANQFAAEYLGLVC